MFLNFICALLESILGGFADSPFFDIVASFINALLAAFGCGISG